MKLRHERTLMKFDRQLPIYNWLYPLKGQELEAISFREAHAVLDPAPIRSRALYFHIPFCDTICTFCMLSRGLGSEGDPIIEKYTQALIREIRLKADMDSVTSVPPRVIWFGGGTPSTLSADQIRRIGRAMHESFDMSRLEEFTIEFEVKSVTREKVEAFKEIGVNKARFGLQTFNPKYRELFNITATLDQTYRAVELFGEYFDFRSFDILYGMHGQTMTEFAQDIQDAIDLGTESCEFYPINHLVTQNTLHTGYKGANLRALSYVEKMGMTVFLNHYMRNSGYKLYNGHGFARLDGPDPEPAEFTTTTYGNKYHEYCWAHADDDLVGFGASAVTQSLDWTIMNDESRTGYINGLLDNDDIKVKVTRSDHIPYERGLVLHLPYHGRLDKSRVEWDKIDPEVLVKLDELVREGMFEDRPHEYVITELGWTWYVNMMYYLSPSGDQKILDDFIELRSRNKALVDGDRSMTPVGKGRRLPVVATS
ncbi:radical SAM protein [Nonomuraea sp. NPDC048916]|uniref:radical SAM protein n=1 Tax=Nonomuraea sp. NPDC048916 TaxID=3154232 RepID=UPI0033D37772